MAPPNLPVETWYKILDETISIPKFLDAECLPEVTNPLYIAPSKYDAIYWRMERQRTRLQKVCKSWKAYLGQSEHRYVRIADILHGDVPNDALHRAIRIRYGPCSAPKCTFCQELDITFRDLPALFNQSVIDPGSSPNEMKVEIIDARGDGATFLPFMMINQSGYKIMPRLKAITGMIVSDTFKDSAGSADNSGWTRIMTLLPRLQFIDVTNPGNNWGSFQANGLTTLCYQSPLSPSSLFIPPYWGWPSLDRHTNSLTSLRHIRLPAIAALPLWAILQAHRHGLPTEQPIVEHLIQLLTGIGVNLISLQIGKGSLHHIILPEQIWDLCPRLERFDAGFRFNSPPPLGHPIHTISTFIPPFGDEDMFRPRANIPTKIQPPFFLPSLIRHWPSLRRLIVREQNRGWSDIRQRIVKGGSEVHDWLVELVRECRKHNIILEDQEGVLFEDTGLDKVLNIDST